MNLSELSRVEQRTLCDEAADQLRNTIRNGLLRPGTRLVERNLAERLGMSRIPVREAIQRLVEEGLVEVVEVYPPSTSPNLDHLDNLDNLPTASTPQCGAWRAGSSSPSRARRDSSPGRWRCRPSADMPRP